jgi:Fe-S cluster biosynthesis and repair protein YggX
MSSLPNFSISGIGSNNTLVNFVIELVIQSEAGRNTTTGQLTGAQIKQLFLSGVSVTDLFNAVCLQENPNAVISVAVNYPTDNGNFYPYCSIPIFLDNIPYSVVPSGNYTSIIDEIIGITKLSNFTPAQKQVVNYLPQSYADMFGFGDSAHNNQVAGCWEIPSVQTEAILVARQQEIKKKLLALGHIQESDSSYQTRITNLKANNTASAKESFSYLTNTTFGLMASVGSFTDDETLSINNSNGVNKFSDALVAFNQPSSLWAKRNALQLQVNNLVGWNSDDATALNKNRILKTASDYTSTPINTNVYTINTTSNLTKGNNKSSYWATFNNAVAVLGKPNDMPQDNKTTVVSGGTQSKNLIANGSGVFNNTGNGVIKVGVDASNTNGVIKQQTKAVLSAYARRNVALSDLGQQATPGVVNTPLNAAYGYLGILGSQTDVWPSNTEVCPTPSLTATSGFSDSRCNSVFVTAWMYRNWRQQQVDLANIKNQSQNNPTDSTRAEQQLALFYLGDSTDNALYRMSDAKNPIAVDQTRVGRNGDGIFLEVNSINTDVESKVLANAIGASTSTVSNQFVPVNAFAGYATYTGQKAVMTKNNSLSAWAIWNKWNTLAINAQNELNAAKSALGNANEPANSNADASAWAQYKAAQWNLGRVVDNTSNATYDDASKPAVAPQYSVVEFNLYNSSSVTTNIDPTNADSWNNPNSLLARLQQANVAVNSALYGTNDGQPPTTNNVAVSGDNNYGISSAKTDPYYNNYVSYYNKQLFGNNGASDQNGAVNLHGVNNNRELNSAIKSLNDLILGRPSASRLLELTKTSTTSPVTEDVSLTAATPQSTLVFTVNSSTGAVTNTGTLASNSNFSKIVDGTNQLITALKDSNLVSVFTTRSGLSGHYTYAKNSNYDSVEAVIQAAVTFLNGAGTGATSQDPVTVTFNDINSVITDINNSADKIAKLIARSELIDAVVVSRLAYDLLEYVNDVTDTLSAGSAEDKAQLSAMQTGAKQVAEDALRGIGNLLIGSVYNTLVSVGNTLTNTISSNVGSTWNTNVTSNIRSNGVAAINAVKVYSNISTYLAGLHDALAIVANSILGTTTPSVTPGLIGNIGSSTSGAIKAMNDQINTNATDTTNAECIINDLKTNYDNFIVAQTDFSGARKMFNNFNNSPIFRKQ